MKIAEIFYSLQGEGSLIGMPSLFIRVSGCNLRCSWCDTPYTSWNPEGLELTLDQILEESGVYPASHAVITGGEPMIMPEIVLLSQRLRERRMHITIETAGTAVQPVACDLMSISPKLSNSTPEAPWNGQHERLRWQPAVLAQLMASYEYQLKFVIEKPEDVDEARALIAQLNAPRERVILMPEGADRQILRERGLWLAEIAKKEGFRFSPRLHVELWGNRRGV